MDAALLATLAVHRIDRPAFAQCRNHLALAGDDDGGDVGRHRRRHHGADQQEGGTAGEQVARQPRREDDEGEDEDADDEVGVLAKNAAIREDAADAVVDDPEGDKEGEGGDDGGGRRPVEHRLVDQEGAGVEEVEHREKGKAGEPGRVALPHRPVQSRRQFGRRHRVLLLVIEAPAVHRPELAADALGAVGCGFRGRQAVVEADEVERSADPGDAGDDVGPAQQQVEPVEQIGRVHGATNCMQSRRRFSCRDRSSTTMG